MILRRFSKHLSEQNWFAVVLEVLVVITGIFLGMQATEWNELQSRKASVISILDRASQELDVNIKSLDKYIKILDDLNTTADRVLVSILKCDQSENAQKELYQSIDEFSVEFLPQFITNSLLDLSARDFQTIYSDRFPFDYNTFINKFQTSNTNLKLNENEFWVKHIIHEKVLFVALAESNSTTDDTGIVLGTSMNEICNDREATKKFWFMIMLRQSNQEKYKVMKQDAENFKLIIKKERLYLVDKY